MWHDIDQNTDDWLALRAGKITGSSVGKIMANYGKAFGEPAKKLAVDIAIERLTGKPIRSSYTNAHMVRGHEQEPIARQLYEEEYFCDVTNGGFFDNGNTGCSPDGRVSNGLIEIKSVVPSVQFETVRKGRPDSKYRWQLVHNVRESGADWIDYVSYCADFPIGRQLRVYRIDRNEMKEDMAMMKDRLAEFQVIIARNIEVIGNA